MGLIVKRIARKPEEIYEHKRQQLQLVGLKFYESHMEAVT